MRSQELDVTEQPSRACLSSQMGERPWRLSTREKEMAIHFSISAWEIPWTEEMAGYSPRGHKGVRHNLVTEQ